MKVKEVDSILKFMTLTIANNLISNSKLNDEYIIYDTEYCIWKNQSWCDHNIFGFYPSDKCVVYSLKQLKNEVSNL